MKKRRKKLKIVSFLLSISLLVTAFTPFTVFAEEPSHEQLTDSSQLWTPEQEEPLPNTEGDLPLEELETAELASEDIPEMVSQVAIEQKGHVNRLWAQEEDLNTVIFQNRDGKKTMYYFTEPVKYKDKDGNIKDKKNKLTEQENTYTNAENDINSYFPKKIHKNKGVVLRHNDIEIEVAPLINGSSGASRQTGHNKDGQPTEYVEYPAVFDDSISVRYTPTFGGFKEDIILSENVGINEFSFKIKTNGLQLTEEDGFVFLSDPLDGKVKAHINPIYVYDSFEGEKTEENSHDSYNNQLLVEIVQADEEYILTVIADDEFLNAPDTVYPVYVDPSMTVMGNGDIADAAIYSKINYNLSATEQQQIKIGCDSFYGIGRGLYNFPIMDFNLDFVFLYGNQISSATLNLYYLSNTSNDSYSTLSLYEFGSSWSEGTVKWNNTSPYNYNRFISAQSIGGGSGYKSFDISYVTNQFKTDPDYTTAFKGLMLKADNESGTWKKFVSSEGASNRQPYIQITYNDQPTACAQVTSGTVYYIKNYNSEYLDISNSGTQAITYPFNGASNQQFKIVNVTGAEYEIYPMFNTEKVLSSNGTDVYIDTDCNLSNQRWYIYYRNGSYHFVNKAHRTKLLEQSYDAVDREVTLGNQYDYCCWELFDIDPFHPSNIEYIRIKKYENSDTITTVVQSAIQSAPYFKLLKYDGEEFDFIINSSLINQLNSLEIAYSNLPTAYPPNAPYYFHVAKLWVDTLVADGILEYGSPEYYGMWASSGNNQLEAVQNFTDQLELAVAVITVAYSVYNVVTSIRALSQAVNSTQTISNSQYVTYYNQTRSNYLSGGTGYSSFEQAKSALGSAGSNKAWHHIVEQNQISGSGFSATNIHNTKNLISIPSGYSGSVHSQITGHYASIQPYTNGMTVRQWLAGQSFQVQFEYGLQQLNNYGTVLATETGWAFIPN